jgi:glycosyltransferase involved in cell wall biosynthesis
MKILHLLNAYEPDGPGRLILDLTQRLVADHCFVCETAALSRGGPLREEFESAGIPTIVLGRGASLAGMAGGLAACLRAGSYEAVHTNLPRADLLGRWAAARAGVPAIFSTEHGIHTWNTRGRLLRPLIAGAYRWTARRATRIVAVSRFVADQLRAEGLPAEKIAVIPNGVDTERFRPLSNEERLEARKAFGVDDQGRLVVAAGKMVPLKGHRLLCQALAEALPRADLAEVQVRIAGEGPEREACEQIVRNAGLGRRVRFLGHVGAQLPRLLGAADLLVQPSRMESFGLAAAESMACAVPVMAFAVGGLPELIREGKEGYLIEPNDAAALSAGLRQALGDPERLEALGLAAAERVRKEFDIRRTATAYARIFRQEPNGDPPLQTNQS